MADSGWQIAGTGADDAGHGDRSWTAADSVVADDGLGALCSLFNTASLDDSHYLKATDFGTLVPPGASIDGIEVRSEVRDTVAVSRWERVRLVDGSGTIGSVDRSPGSDLAAEYSLYSQGGPTDLWGAGWTAADVNSAGSGFVIAFRAFGSARPAVDAMWRKVYYSGGVAGPPPGSLALAGVGR